MVCRRYLGWMMAIAVLAIFGSAGAVGAQPESNQPAAPPAAQPAAVTEGTTTGAVDWSKGVVTAYGEGAVPANAPNPGAARLMAIRAAKSDALRNVLELIRKIKVTSETTVENSMVSSDVIRTRVEGTIQGAEQVGEPVYLSDTTVRVTLRVPLAGNLEDAVLPASGFNAEAAKSFAAIPPGGNVFTGLVIDARGLKVKPAMAPKILDPQGSELYGTGQVNRDYAVQQGLVGYARVVEDARKDSRVTDHPLVVKAVKARGTLGSDVQVSEADAKRIREAAEHLNFLEQCRVMIVVD